MGFKVLLAFSAEKDLEDAIDYYHQINQILPERFYDEFLELILLLETNPYFQKKYDLARTFKLKSFPYLVHFVINEECRVVKIIAIVFGRQEKTNFSNPFSDL